MLKRAAALFCSLLIAAFISASPASAESWQCAPYARLASGIQIFGNAATWWNQADGEYLRGHAPKVGAVLVFKASHAMRVGHVATVSEIVDARTIRVTHANWSPINGRRGQIEKDVLVIDTSADNDWSKVRVWYHPIGDLGTSAYPTYGFIYADDAALRVAALDSSRAQLAAAATSDAATARNMESAAVTLASIDPASATKASGPAIRLVLAAADESVTAGGPRRSR